MKILVVVAILIAVAVARPSARDTIGILTKRDDVEDLVSMADPESEKAEKLEPMSMDDALELLGDADSLATDVRDMFSGLKTRADEVTGTEESLSTLGDHIRMFIGDLGTVAEERLPSIVESWMHNMEKIIYAGVEDQGQCHKVLEFLIEALDEADAVAKREMSTEELEFWMKVSDAAKEEVACIIDRFNEFIDMVAKVSDAINNPPAEYNEDGHAFEAEVLMGAMMFGFGHLYRQVAVFAHVMHALLEEEEKHEGTAGPGGELRALLKQTEMIKSRMEQSKRLHMYRNVRK